jgi:hypothetical protein
VRHGELHAMTLGERHQLQVLAQIGQHRGVASDEFVGFAPHQEALPVEQRGWIAARVGAAEVERYRERTEQVRRNAAVFRTQIDREEIEWAGLGRRYRGFEKPRLIPSVGVGKQDPARGQHTRAGHTRVRFAERAAHQLGRGQHAGAGLARGLGGAVFRTVVDHDHRIVREAADCASNPRHFVTGRDHHHAVGRGFARGEDADQRERSKVATGPQEKHNQDRGDGQRNLKAQHFTRS